MARAESLDLGEVWEQKNFIYELPIRNQTKSEVQVVEIRSSCGCTDVEPRRMRIPAGHDAKLRIGIYLFHRDRFEVGQFLRPFAVEVTPITNQLSTGKSGWRLSGSIRSRVTLDAVNIHFGDEPVQGQNAAVRRVVATVHVPVEDLQVQLVPPLGSVSVLSNEENRYVVEVSPSPDLPVGPFAGELLVTVADKEGARHLAGILPIAGNMQPEIRILPASVTLAPQPIGTIAEATIVLQVPEGVEPRVQQIEASTSDLSIVPVDVPGIHKGRAYRLSQRVTTVGDANSSAIFVVRVGEKPEQRLKIDIRFHGADSK